MKKEINILIACGTGTVCSNLIHYKIDKLKIKERLNIKQCAIKDIDDNTNNIDLLVLALEIDKQYPIKTVVVNGYILEKDEDQMDKLIIDAISEISKQDN